MIFFYQVVFGKVLEGMDIVFKIGLRPSLSLCADNANPNFVQRKFQKDTATSPLRMSLLRTLARYSKPFTSVHSVADCALAIVASEPPEGCRWKRGTCPR